MPFGLTIGTERAATLQQAIQDELTVRGFSPDADPVMAEYITIMVINNKTPAQITSELEELIGSDFEPSFTDWLFVEAAKGVETEEAAPAVVQAQPSAGPVASTREVPPHIPARGRNNVYQQALSQALPSTAGKRLASARSPSPNSAHPNKTRRTGSDLPTGPRAMLREGPTRSPTTNTRSLIDRVGAARAPNNFMENSSDMTMMNPGMPEQNIMNGGFPDMSMVANPMMLQEMMLSQMAMMAQMANSMGMAPGFVPGMQGDMPMGMYQNPYQPQMNGHGNNNVRGRGGRGGNSSRGRGQQPSITPSEAPVIIAPTPLTAPPTSTPTFTLPSRPQSPTLCKFSVKCSNAHCRYSHPSPVATPESGIVLSNEACEQKKECKDKDCVKAHVSPAVLDPIAAAKAPPAPTQIPNHVPAAVPCRFGPTCTRTGCTFSHPPRHSSNSAPTPASASTQCRFGAACTRSTCPFLHPEGRVLPATFHRGLGTSGPMVNVHTPEAGSMGPSASVHRSVVFNAPSSTNNVKDKLEEQLKELRAAIAAKEGASSTKGEDGPAVPIAV